jgi:replicative DNA helicase
VTNTTDRMMPMDLDAERALLGAILLTQSNADVVRTILPDGSDEFSREANGRLYAVLQHLTQNSQPLDSVLIREEMLKRGHEKLANNDFLAEFLGAVPSEARAAQYARTVHGMHLRRKTIQAVEQVLAGAYDTRVKLKDVLARCESQMLNLMESAVGSGAVHISVALDEFLSHVNDELGRGLPTGINGLDNMLDGGLRKSELFVLGARPATGKTAFAMGILEHVCCSSDKPALFFTLEMSAKQVAGRFVTSRSCVPLKALRAKDLTPEQDFNFARSKEQIRKAKMYVDASENMSVGEICARSRIAQRRFGVELIAIDHLHHGIRPNRNYETDELRLRDIVHTLKALAKELDIPVLLLAQLNRQAADVRPMIQHLRGSGAIEEAADVAALLWRPEMLDYRNHGSCGVRPDVESATLIIAKQRDGPVGDLDLTWHAPTMQFTDGRPGVPRQEPARPQQRELTPNESPF